MDVKSKMNYTLLSGIYKFFRIKIIRTCRSRNSVEMKIIQIAKKLIRIIKSKSNIINQLLLMDDLVQRNHDITLAKNKLYWTSKNLRDMGLFKNNRFF